MKNFYRFNIYALPTFLSVGLFAGLLQVSATSAESNATQTNSKQLLIDQTHLEPKFLLPPAPAATTAKGQRELFDIKNLVANITPEQRQQAAKDAMTKNVSFFKDVVPGLDLEKLPRTKALFEQVRYTEDTEAKIFKDHFMRKRPYVTDSSIQLCVEPEKDADNASYPSGHATMGFSMAVILANLIPERAPEILERAQQYADNRMICGAHHLSDIVAGQVLGTVVALELMKNQTFKQQMDTTRLELKAAGLTQ